MISPKIFLFLLFVIVAQQLFAQDEILLIPYHAKKGWGYSDTLAHIKIQPAAYDSVDFFNYKGFARVYKKNKLNVIDSTGKLLLKEYYNQIDHNWNTDDLELWNKNKVGVYSFTKRRYLLPVKYDKVTNWTGNEWYVTLKNKSALFSQDGKQLTGFKYDSMKTINSTFMIAYIEGKLFKVMVDTGIATQIDTIPESEDDGVYFFEEPVEEGEPVLPLAPVEFAERLKNNMDLDSLERRPVRVANNPNEVYRLHKKGKVGFYFWNNRDYVMPHYDGLYEVISRSKTNYYMIAELNGKQGVINETEKEIIPIQYDSIYSLNRSSAYTMKEGKRGVWMFNTVYPPIQNKYDAITYARRLSVSKRWQFLVFKVRKNNQTGYVGENGVEYFEQ